MNFNAFSYVFWAFVIGVIVGAGFIGMFGHG